MLSPLHCTLSTGASPSSREGMKEGTPKFLAGREPARQKGGWRAEKRKSYGSCLAARGRLSARQSRTSPATGPRFPVRESRSSRPKAGSAIPKSSASSWQGLLVVPGGVPMPPECSCCVHEPAGAAPRPASRTPRDAPFKWTRWVQHNWGWERGDNLLTMLTSAKCHKRTLWLSTVVRHDHGPASAPPLHRIS
jgi:hypothetical protein